ncbi:MAG: tryptophan-rich sensory protein [Candidatus Fonsibacter ubiquis]|nr:tryptophan-rich sensory protein [Candidatus Fonsibacter ubiquis]
MNLKSKSTNYLGLFFIIFATFLITFPAGFITKAAMDPWYYNLVKPAFNPPNWVFGPVWTILYAMMSVAVWLAYNKSKHSNKILVIYFVHLFINASWSYVFFYYKQIFLASFVISIIIFFILYLMVLYSKYSKPSVVLMLPYFAWSTYALYLNSTIYILNSSY